MGSLRSHSKSLQTQVSQLTDSRETLHNDLQRARKAADRQRMEHEKAELLWRVAREKEREADSGPDKLANGSGHATPNGKMEDVRRVLV